MFPNFNQTANVTKKPMNKHHQRLNLIDSEREVSSHQAIRFGVPAPKGRFGKDKNLDNFSSSHSFISENATRDEGEPCSTQWNREQ